MLLLIHRRLLLSSASLLFASLFTGCGHGPRPNIVLVIIDTLRADKLSSYGFALDTSPALSRLAERGVQFDSVTAQTSWTLPSVGSMLTSRYPRSLGLYSEEAQKLPDGVETLAEVLQVGGYTTFGITANPNLNSRYNFQQGFGQYHDSVVVFNSSVDDVPEGKVSYRNTALRTAPDIFNSVLEFAEQSAGAEPYFVLVDLMEVHEYFNGRLRRKEYDELFPEDPAADYLRMVRQVTDDLERFVERLCVLPGWNDTLFVFTSDHGEGLKDHPTVDPSRGHGALLYRSHVSVPWIMFNPTWESVPVRSHITQRVRLLDLMPTLIDYAELEVPFGVEGQSLRPLIEGRVDGVPMPEFLITETNFRNSDKISAIGERWQYCDNRKEHRGLPRVELQAWDQKPSGRRTDQSSEHTQEVERMRAFIAEWESNHPAAEPTPIEGELDEATRAQLEAVGYLGGDDDE